MQAGVRVFRVELMPLFGADPIVWFVVGDFPPAYIAFEQGDTWQDVCVAPDDRYVTPDPHEIGGAAEAAARLARPPDETA